MEQDLPLPIHKKLKHELGTYKGASLPFLISVRCLPPASPSIHTQSLEVTVHEQKCSYNPEQDYSVTSTNL